MCGFAYIEKNAQKSISAFLSVILCLCDAAVLFLELLPYPPEAFLERCFYLSVIIFDIYFFGVLGKVAAEHA